MVIGSPSGAETMIRMMQIFKLVTIFNMLPPAATSISILIVSTAKMTNAEIRAYFIN